MTDETIQDDLEDEYETELSRLGSSKALYALTGGEMETEAVVSRLADSAATAAETFEGWTDDEAFDEFFETMAETAGEHAERIAETADDAPSEDAEPTDAPTATDEVLRDLDDSAARLGGLIAWALITDRTLAQAVGFFVGNADTTAADLFRDLRADVDVRLEEALAHAEDVDDAAARAAAGQVVEAAYDHYADSLEAMGVKVKPVC